jgi:hypothetical protein
MGSIGLPSTAAHVWVVQAMRTLDQGMHGVGCMHATCMEVQRGSLYATQAVTEDMQPAAVGGAPTRGHM